MDKLYSTLKAAAVANDFYGAISIYKNGQPLFNKAYGYRDKSNEIPNDCSTKFGIASGTKLFTALGIGVLLDRKRISLLSTMEEIFGNQITFIDKHASIKQLLNHTSGIFDYYDEETVTDFDNYHVAIPWFKLETPSDYFPLFKTQKMKFPAGERFSYSNGGYILLGIIIEKISGELYRNFISKYVLEPAGMNATGFFAMNNLPKNTANGYMQDFSSNIFNLPLRGASDGGLFATGSDIHSMWKKLFSGDIISENQLKTYITPSITIREQIQYGYGIYMHNNRKHPVYYIAGSDAGVGFHSKYIPGQNLNINILSNKTDGEECLVEVIDNFLEL